MAPLQHCHSCEIAKLHWNEGSWTHLHWYSNVQNVSRKVLRFHHQVSKSGISQDGSVKAEFHKLHRRKRLGLIVYRFCRVVLVYCILMYTVYVSHVVCVVMFVAALLSSVATAIASYCQCSPLLKEQVQISLLRKN